MTIKKWRKMIRQTLEAEGCTVIGIRQERKHFKIDTALPDGTEYMFVTSLTPSDGIRGRLNFRGDIRRAIRCQERGLLK